MSAVNLYLNSNTVAKEIRIKSLQHNEELVLDGGDGEEVVINNVTNSVVRIPFKASAVHIKCVKHSKLIFAPIKTSVLMRDCENLTVVVAAQQLRVHNSHQILFYIEVCFRFPEFNFARYHFLPYMLTWDSFYVHCILLNLAKEAKIELTLIYWLHFEM